MIYRGCRLKCRISKSIQNLERYRTLKYGQRVQNVLKCMFHIETLRFFSDSVNFPIISLDTSIICWLGVRYTGLKFMTGYHIY